VKRHAQTGFSVVELMVAMTISLLLLAGVLSVLYTSRITYDENARVSRLQEYARASVELVLRDLRSAGNPGCARPIRPERFRNSLANANALRYNFARPVEGFEGTDGAFAPAVDGTVIPNATAGNDILVIRSLVTDVPPLRTSAAFAGGTGSITVEKPVGTGIPTGTPLIISDCEFANVFTNSAAVGTAGATGTLNRGTGVLLVGGTVQTPQNTATSFPVYRQGSLVTAVETVVYYIRDSATGRGPALWRIVGNRPAQELVEGVERLEVQYGEDTNGDLLVDEYRDANDVVNWNNVISVTLAVLMRSPDDGLDAAGNQTWDMLGTEVGPFDDRRPRIMFTTTATVRNRATDLT
jgi:type IV pilus assembly protein PilW